MADPIGPAIEGLRKRRGWKRTDLAGRVGCSYRHIYGLEHEINVASEEMLQRIANEFDVALCEVMKNAPKPPRKAPTSTPSPSNPVPPPRPTKSPSRAAEDAA